MHARAHTNAHARARTQRPRPGPQDWNLSVLNRGAHTATRTSYLLFRRLRQVLLVLDALDEADKGLHQQQQAGGGAPVPPSALDNKALQLLLHQLSLLPPCVRILTTMRPEQHLLEPLRSRFPRLLELGPGQLRRAAKTQARPRGAGGAEGGAYVTGGGGVWLGRQEG